MTKFTRLLGIGLLALSLTACGKTDEQKAVDNAKSDLKEQRALAHELSVTPPPGLDQPDEAINAYEKKVNRLETLENNLRRANNGKNIDITVEGSGEFIKNARAYIQAFRAAKAKSSTTTELKIKVQTLEVANQSILEKIAAVSQDQNISDTSRLNTMIELHQTVISNSNLQLAALNALRDQGLNYLARRESVVSVKTKSEERIRTLKELLSTVHKAG